MVFAFVLALVAAAEEEKTLKVLPYAYNAFPYTYGAYNSPLAYNTPYAYSGYHHATAAYPYIQPVATKVVPKEFEVEVKSYEFEPVSTGCKNQFGFDVPCAKSKRSADEEETKPVLPFLPISYNALPYAHPGFGYSTYSPAAAYGVAPYYPYLTYALPVGTCKNVEGELVPCAKQVVKRSADDEEKKVLTYAAAAYNPFPYNYNYATLTATTPSPSPHMPPPLSPPRRSKSPPQCSRPPWRRFPSSPGASTTWECLSTATWPSFVLGTPFL